MVVVLPAPFGPTRAKTLPVGTCRFSASTASSRPNRRVRSTVSIALVIDPISAREADHSGPVPADRCHNILQRQVCSLRLPPQPLRIVFEEEPTRCGGHRPAVGDNGTDSRSDDEQSLFTLR